MKKNVAYSLPIRASGFGGETQKRFRGLNKVAFWRENGVLGNPGDYPMKKSVACACRLMVGKPRPARKCFSFLIILQFLFICANSFISIFFYFFVGVKGGREGAVRERERELRGRLFNTGS